MRRFTAYCSIQLQMLKADYAKLLLPHPKTLFLLTNEKVSREFWQVHGLEPGYRSQLLDYFLSHAQDVTCATRDHSFCHRAGL